MDALFTDSLFTRCSPPSGVVPPFPSQIRCLYRAWSLKIGFCCVQPSTMFDVSQFLLVVTKSSVL